MIELSDENRLNDHLWVDIEGHDEEGRYQTGCRPATPAEVAEAHPKCGTCGHKWTHDVQYYGMIGYEFPITVHDCTYENNPKTLGFRPKRIDPTLDYCLHHSELTKEG